MQRKKPTVVVSRKLPDVVETRMMELFDTHLNLDDAPMTKEALIAAVAEADVLVPTITDVIDADIIKAAGPNLKLIANFGVGVEHIDLAAAKARGVVVSNTPGVLADDTADMAMAMILATARRLGEGERVLRSGDWGGWSPTWMLGRRLNGKRLGIVGLGRVGQALARRARGFGLSIHYHNRKPVHDAIAEELEATYWESLDQMLARMDIVSIHCPATPATFHLISGRRLKLLQSHAVIVNTARGSVIDEEALVPMLVKGEIAGAALDVFEHAPAIDSRLLKLENVVLLPHMGSATLESRIAMGERVMINIRSMIDGNPPPDRVLGDLP